MTKDELNYEYFKWMCQLVMGDACFKHLTYWKLLRCLHSIDFFYILEMDGNRAEDGVDLRYRFGSENRYEAPVIATYLDNRACSVLEMLVALAIRCEEHIMDDPDIGNRTGQWFWGMIENLGLRRMNDDIPFDGKQVRHIICRFLNREYSRTGRGGLFTVPRYEGDLRTVEIWYQMNLYLESTL